MAYSQTTASSSADVISQFCTFAIANAGFADAGTVTIGSRTLRRISKGGIYWHFIPFATGNGIKAYMAYSAQSSEDAVSSAGQGYSTYCSCWAFPGPYPTLYMYAHSGCVHVAIELTNGIFNHLSFGNITKTDTFTGGEYLTGGSYQNTYSSPAQYYSVGSSQQAAVFAGQSQGYSYSNGFGYMRAVKPAGPYNNSQDFAPIGASSDYALRCAFSAVNSMLERLLRDSPNTATLRTPLFPMYVSLFDSASGLYRLSGYVPGVRVCGNKYVDPAEIVLTNWQCFPLTQKDASALICAPCGNYGLAYQRA